ncbi:MAG TPA: multicopper oxidase domain-containing protein [Bryobacteraceae bacterium]
MNSPLNAPNQDSSSMIPSRRRFMLSAIASAFGLSVADLLFYLRNPAAAQAPPPGCSQSFEKFVPVAEFLSQNKKLALTMTVKGTTRNVATIAGQGYQCKSMRLRYYDAQVGIPGNGAKWPENASRPGPGPTLRMRVGDTVQINLVNALNPAFFGRSDSAQNGCDLKTTQNGPLYPGNDDLPSCFHGDNVTNLHYHGTHVTPDGKGDNVMVDVPVGKNFENDFTIPTDPPPSNSTDFNVPFKMGQAPGTHWYHAHKHGSVALQLLNGMAGAFIIEGVFDDQLETLIPGLRKTEKVLVIQQLGETITIQPGPPLNTCAGGDPLPLVNGQLQPTVDMQPGEIQRWRIINATMQQASHLTYRFLGEQAYAASKGSPTFPANPGYVPAIRQIAYDGIQLAPERYNDPAFGQSQEFTIAPANRIDILVQAPSTPGTSLLAFRLLHGPPPAGCQPNSISDLYLLRLNVAGTPMSPAMNFPTAANYPKMPAWLQWDENDPRNNIVKERTLKFNQTNDLSSRPAIDAKVYNHKPDTTQYIDLNTAEEWTLENYWDSSIHPFHIHVNPFQVLEIFDPRASTQVTLQAPYNWRDTISIPASVTNGTTITPGRVRIRSRFVDFPGSFVLHCHILDHEDRGMMQEVQILDPKSRVVPPLPMHQ